MSKNYNKNTMMFNAQAFMAAANFLHENSNPNDNPILKKVVGIKGENVVNINLNALTQCANFFPPIIVCGTFACEIFIKLMLPQKIMCHRLDCLFKKMDIRLRKRIIKATIDCMTKKTNKLDYDEEDFYNDLDIHSDAFEKWRYFYEEKSKPANTQFVLFFMKSLYDVAYEQLQQGAKHHERT